MGKTRDPRSLSLKIRVIRPVGTSDRDTIDTIERALRTGVLPKGWRIKWVDWAKGDEGSASGRLSGSQLADLRVFYEAITHANTRLRVEKPGE